MAEVTYFVMTIRALPEGGFVVAAGTREYGDRQEQEAVLDLYKSALGMT